MILTGRYPIAFLRFEMPPEAVDVNVHPTKLEVRFQDSGRLYSQLLGTMRTKFLTVDLNTKLRAEGAGVRGQESEPGAGVRNCRISSALGTVVSDPNLAVDERAGGTAAAGIGRLGERASWLESRESSSMWRPSRLMIRAAWGCFRHASERKPLELVRIDRTALAIEGDRGSTDRDQKSRIDHRPLTRAMRRRQMMLTDRRRRCRRFRTAHSGVPAMQVHNRYLIAESDDGVVVIDQHALHERILYEQLRERVLAGALETQRLLVPEAVDLVRRKRRRRCDMRNCWPSLA